MSRSPIPNLPCMASSVRRASRALTQRYEEALRPVGLRATQFTVLQVLSLAGEVPQGKLAEMLAMDSTSLTRTLAIMLRQGWVAERRGDRPGEDQRQRWLRLAKAGRIQLNRALPAWEKVQSQLRHELGDQRWNALFQLTNQVTEFATRQSDTRQHKETL
jgi:DNA-binding MarR family transcriptional regulator